MESRSVNDEKLDPTSLKPSQAPPEGYANVALEAKNLGGRGDVVTYCYQNSYHTTLGGRLLIAEKSNYHFYRPASFLALARISSSLSLMSEANGTGLCSPISCLARSKARALKSLAPLPTQVSYDERSVNGGYQ